jgi:hypothetical protein
VRGNGNLTRGFLGMGIQFSTVHRPELSIVLRCLLREQASTVVSLGFLAGCQMNIEELFEGELAQQVRVTHEVVEVRARVCAVLVSNLRRNLVPGLTL